MEISFGQKIPVMSSKVFDKQTNQFVDATVYEIDAKDENDYVYVAMQGEEIPYKTYVSSSIYSKYKKYENGELSPNVLDNYKKFYSLEVEDGKMSALMETVKANNYADITWMSSDQSGRYGFLGQTLMASLMKQMLSEKDPTLMVSNPSIKGKDFYINTCGFKQDAKDEQQVSITKQGMSEFLARFARNTHQKSLDVAV